LYYDSPHGAVAEWLGRGLQSLVQQFDSAPRLHALSQSPACSRRPEKLELARERRASGRHQEARNSNQAKRNSCRHEESDDGCRDHESRERSEQNRTTESQHGFA
jgi:hypothetical protein